MLGAVVAALLVPAALGFRRYVIVGGSMEPTIHRGALVYARTVPVASLRVGDVITYVPPGQTKPVTHRLRRVARDSGGERVFQTKGDANAAPDPRTFTLSRPTQARYAFDVPYVGYVLALLGIPAVRVAVVAVPALAIGLWLLVGLWRDAGRLVRDADLDLGSELEAAGEVA